MIKSKMKWLIGGLTLIVFLAGGLFYFIATAPTDESIRQLQADADKLRRQGKYDRAEEYYRKSIKQSDQKYGENNIAAASAYTGLGALFTQKQDHAKAADNLLLAADIYQHSAGNAIYPEKLFALKLAATLSLEKTRDYKKADSIYNFVEKHLNGLPPELQFKYYLYRGRSYYNRHEFKQSLFLLEKANKIACFKSTENKMELYELLGTSYGYIEHDRKSIFFLEKLIKLTEKDNINTSAMLAFYYHCLGRSLIGVGEFKKAEEKLLKSISLIKACSDQDNLYPSLLFHNYLYLAHIAIATKNKTKCSKYWKHVEILKKEDPSLNLKTYILVKENKVKNKM